MYGTCSIYKYIYGICTSHHGDIMIHVYIYEKSDGPREEELQLLSINDNVINQIPYQIPYPNDSPEMDWMITSEMGKSW